MIDLCRILRDIPRYVDKKQFGAALEYLGKEARKMKDSTLLNWLKNKENNRWMLQCLSIATSQMSRDD
jgi:thioredoxin-related protein